VLRDSSNETNKVIDFKISETGPSLVRKKLAPLILSVQIRPWWRFKFINLSKMHTLLSCVLLKLSPMLLLGCVYLVSSLYIFYIIFILILFWRIITCVLFLFINQEKEGLITELRKELRVSDDEHRELLGRVNSDEIIHRIRYCICSYLTSCKL